MATDFWLKFFLPLAALSRYHCAWKMAYFSTEPASERRNVTGKNRVWDFFRLSNETHPANRRQPAQPRRKIRPTAMKTASGIPSWPSRDPIGEDGGLNLYGFVENDGVNQADDLGLTPPVTPPKPMPYIGEPVPAERYATKWKQENMFRDQSKDKDRATQFKRGCVGITCLNLGYPDLWPEQDPGTECFRTKLLAEKASKDKKCPCDSSITAPSGGRPSPRIFSIHLWNDIGIDPKKGPDVTFDSEGKADMSNWDHEGKEGLYTNFDYGFLNQNGLIEHANHYHTPSHPMVVFYTRPDDWTNFRETMFNLEVWCVKCNFDTMQKDPPPAKKP